MTAKHTNGIFDSNFAFKTCLQLGRFVFISKNLASVLILKMYTCRICLKILIAMFLNKMRLNQNNNLTKFSSLGKSCVV